MYALRNNDTLSKLILESLANEGQTIRKWYQRRLPSDTSKDYYFIHRQTGRTEPVLIEYGFVDNLEDANFIKNNWQDLAEATVRAVATYIGVPYDNVMDEGIYVVQKGDSLYSIAKKLDVSVDAIKSANNITNNLINIGQKLIIPGYVEPNLSTITYVVKKGDSLYSIANKYDTTVSELKKINNLSSNLLNIGDSLKIPSKEVIDIEPEDPAPTNTYTVEYGDTLTKIALDNNIDVNDLIDLNNLTDYELYVGQILKLPTLVEEEIIRDDEYIVQKGDSLYKIANLYNTTVNELKLLNNLNTNELDVGQILKIPTKESTTIDPSVSSNYVVQKGDSLYSIANKYNTTVDKIKTLNNLTSNLLSVGQVLKLPTNENYNIYVVKPNDSLYSIAREYNTTVDEIKTLNNLSTNVLSIGQSIKVPN